MSNQKIKTYLITGGAGFLGINLVRYLLARQQRVTVLDIAPFDYRYVTARVRAFRGDIRRRNDVQTAMQGADIVVHAAAALPLYKPADIYSTDVEGTQMLLEEAARQKVERFIHISSTAEYGV